MNTKNSFARLFDESPVNNGMIIPPCVTHDITTQKGLVASLIQDIRYFDYYYNFSDDHTVWKKYHALKLDIQARLEKVEDAELAANLSNCFNKDNYKAVVEFAL